MIKIFFIFIFYFLLNGVIECQKFNNGPFTDRLASYIIDYFELDKLLLTERLPVNDESRFKYNSNAPYTNRWNYTGHYNNSNYYACDSLERIEDYFFQVYGSKENFTLKDLDDLIHFHVKKARRSYNEVKHRQYKCQRDHVNNFISVQSILIFM
jgi:hypothetical protein